MTTAKRGFTLIELLIVIGILAILATTVVLVLNPAQILAETRDTQRFSEVDALKGAISLALNNNSNITLTGGIGNCYTSRPTEDTPGIGCDGRAVGSTTVSAARAGGEYRRIDGTGWMPVNLGTFPGGSPLPTLPIDPSNTATLFYTYGANDTAKVFEIDMKPESTKYTAATGVNAKAANDGGNSATLYEVGTALNLP